MQAHEPINFRDKFAMIHEHWSPRVIAELNDYQFKLVRLKGEFVWHKHDDTDEAFIVLDGNLVIELSHGRVQLSAGEMFVVQRGMEHRPRAQEECHVLLVEPRGVVNTGDAGGDMTAPGDRWV